MDLIIPDGNIDINLSWLIGIVSNNQVELYTLCHETTLLHEL